MLSAKILLLVPKKRNLLLLDISIQVCKGKDSPVRELWPAGTGGNEREKKKDHQDFIKLPGTKSYRWYRLSF